MKRRIKQIDLKLLKQAAGPSVWDNGNRVLYDLCKKYPCHANEEEILAKVWLIGRSYSAAIERRPNSEHPGDRFYIEVVGPRIRNSKIDKWLAEVSRYNKPSTHNCSEIIAVHSRVTDLFKEISGIEKRSLASKYLHFHLPRLFYIYDSRASLGLANVVDGLGHWTPEFKVYRSEERRVGKECRSRWSPYH